MYTLDRIRKKEDRRKEKTAISYLCAAILCLLFACIYEHFSYGVYSIFMIGAFLFPLILGGFVFFLLWFFDKPTPSDGWTMVYHCGVATLTVGSIVKGVLEIYGTTNWLTGIYWIVGILFVGIGVIGYGFRNISVNSITE
ncbi:hypothetical protein P261_01943 [Lachnospiraceae bacterium TWA4]|nr:hypothetical protein P261_01943 [Lachnospiraceae bacterium TWA4]